MEKYLKRQNYYLWSQSNKKVANRTPNTTDKTHELLGTWTVIRQFWGGRLFVYPLFISHGWSAAQSLITWIGVAAEFMNNSGESVMWVWCEGILHNNSVGCMVSPQVWINSFAQSDHEIRSVEGRNLVANDDELGSGGCFLGNRHICAFTQLNSIMHFWRRSIVQWNKKTGLP